MLCGSILIGSVINFLSLLKTPSTFVISKSLLDLSFFAIALAAVSPFILKVWLFLPKPKGAIIGILFLLRTFSIKFELIFFFKTCLAFWLSLFVGWILCWPMLWDGFFLGILAHRKNCFQKAAKKNICSKQRSYLIFVA